MSKGLKLYCFHMNQIYYGFYNNNTPEQALTIYNQTSLFLKEQSLFYQNPGLLFLITNEFMESLNLNIQGLKYLVNNKVNCKLRAFENSRIEGHFGMIRSIRPTFTCLEYHTLISQIRAETFKMFLNSKNLGFSYKTKNSHYNIKEFIKKSKINTKQILELFKNEKLKKIEISKELKLFV